MRRGVSWNSRKWTAAAMGLLLLGSTTVLPCALAATVKTTASKAPVIRTTLSKNTSFVELTMGKANIIHLNQPATKVSISDPNIVGIVMISPTDIELIGKSLGVANMLIWTNDNMQSYLTVDLSVHRDVSTLANKIQLIDPGINILPVAAEDSVILTGVAESAEKAQLAHDLAQAFFDGDEKAEAASSNSPGSAYSGPRSTKIINLIRIMGQPMTKAEFVQEKLHAIDPGIKLDVVPGFGGKERAILTGKVKTSSMVSKAVNLVSVFYGTPGIKVVTGPGGNVAKEGKEPTGGSFTGETAGLIGNLSGNMLYGSVITDTSGSVISMLEVSQRPQVVCEIKFLEVRKTNGTDFNPTALLITNRAAVISPYKYPADASSTTVTGLVTRVVNSQNGNAQAGYVFGQDFSAILNGLVTEGKARVLAQPKITTMSGEPGSFISGGEFPIPFIGSNGQVTVIFKEFGIRLNVLPTVTERGTIHLQVSPEVSELDFTNGVTLSSITVPALTSRRSQTVLEMKDGENFMLSGLYRQTTTHDLRKMPFLGQIPILGELFRNQTYSKSQSELLVIIHPRILWGDESESEKAAADVPSEIRDVKHINPEEVSSDYAKLMKKTGNTKPASIPQQPVAQNAPVQTSLENSAETKKSKKASKKQSRDAVTQTPPVQTSNAFVAQSPVPESTRYQTESFMEQHQQALQDLLQGLEAAPAAATVEPEPQYQPEQEPVNQVAVPLPAVMPVEMAAPAQKPVSNNAEPDALVLPDGSPAAGKARQSQSQPVNKRKAPVKYRRTVSARPAKLMQVAMKPQAAPAEQPEAVIPGDKAEQAAAPAPANGQFNVRDGFKAIQQQWNAMLSTRKP